MKMSYVTMIATCAMSIGISCAFAQTSSMHDVLENPHDQLIQFPENDNIDAMMQELYQKSAPQKPSEMTMESALKEALSRKVKVDPKEKLAILNPVPADVKSERVSRDEVQRGLALPSLSDVSEGKADDLVPENLFLREWELLKDTNGGAVIARIGDPLSKIPVRSGMILGEFGRIMAVRDTPDAFYVVLESGDRINGSTNLN